MYLFRVLDGICNVYMCLAILTTLVTLVRSQLYSDGVYFFHSSLFMVLVINVLFHKKTAFAIQGNPSNHKSKLLVRSHAVYEDTSPPPEGYRQAAATATSAANTGNKSTLAVSPTLPVGFWKQIYPDCISNVTIKFL